MVIFFILNITIHQEKNMLYFLDLIMYYEYQNVAINNV